MTVSSEAAARAKLEMEVARLKEEFKDTSTPEDVQGEVDRALERLKGAEGVVVGDYLGALSVRFARETLRAAAQSEGRLEKEVPEVLFVCVQNAGRSQMAAVMMRSLGGDGVHVRTAGSAPGARIHPVVVEAMKELDMDATTGFPKPLTDEFVKAADVIVTMGCGDSCPVFPDKDYRDWEVGDPKDRPIEDVRKIRDDIRGRVEALLTELGVPITATKTES